MIYVTDTFGVSMFRSLVEGNSVVIGDKSNNIKKTLESLDHYKLLISNKVLIGTFESQGIDLSNAEILEVKKIHPVPGDTVYIINPTEPIYKYKDYAVLPDRIKFTLDSLIFKEE